MTATEEKQGADLTPLEQAAILLLSVGEANAARILRHLGPKEVQKVGAQMASMGDIEARDVSRVMERLLLEANTASGLGVGTESYIRNVLIEALGEERAGTLIDQILMSDKTRGLEALRWMNPKLVANTIGGEHPQIQAVILSYLHPDQAAEVVEKQVFAGPWPRCDKESGEQSGRVGHRDKCEHHDRTPAPFAREGVEDRAGEHGSAAAAGFGVAFLSMHTCVLEMRAGVLALLPMEHNPIERDWHVMHLASRQLPQVALAFERFLVERGQSEIRRQLAAKPAAKKTARR